MNEAPENIIAREIVDAAYKIHYDLGAGLLESVYEVLLEFELKRRGLQVERQVRIPIRYGGAVFEEGFRADMIVNQLVIVEIKSVEETHPSFKKTLLTYLRLAERRLGLLINFGGAQLKGNVHRVANGMPETSEPPSLS
jgi:GxxExxY protein